MDWVNRSVDMILQSSQDKLRHLCRPTSTLVPFFCTMLAFLYAFKAMQGYNSSFPGTKEYHQACPQGTGRTATGILVKLFAATVTTVGIQGHFGSLSDVQSWKLQVFRALEVVVNPLAALFSFALSFWYGFADLLPITSGPWKRNITLKYRLARLCGGYASTKSSNNERRAFLGLVNPQHLETFSSKRDLKWCGRVLILLVLLSQYAQAGVLLSRRVLSNTAADVDYSMAFLVLSGLATLLKSFTVLLLNVTWALHEEIQPCIEELCTLQECTTFKHSQGLPSLISEIDLSKNKAWNNPKLILCHLAGGWLQMAIMSQFNHSIWRHLRDLCTLQLALWFSVYYITLIYSFRKVYLEKFAPQSQNNSSPQTRQLSQTPTNSELGDASPDDTEPLGNAIPDDAEPPSWLSVSVFLTAIAFSAVGFTLGFLGMVLYQLFLLAVPCILLYYSIAELSAWKAFGPAEPCPQLWKDGLEDELWWF